MSLIREIFNNEMDSCIILEEPQNLMISKKNYKRYVEFFNRVLRCFKMAHIHNPNNTSRICSLLGQSCFEYSKKIISSARRICFVGFPFQQLRSISHRIDENALADNIIFAIVYGMNKKSTLINLREDNELLFYKNGSRAFPCYYPLREDESYESYDKPFSHMEIDREKKTPYTIIYKCRDSNRVHLIKSTKNIDFDYIERNALLMTLRHYLVENSVLEAMPQCFVKDKIYITGVVFDNVEGFSLEFLVNEDAKYENMMIKYHMKPCIQNKIKILLSLFSCAYAYHSLGIYFSDIKPDNFIVTKEGDVVPIDADSFSVSNHTSTRPRPEYTYSLPTKERNYYQTHENETYSLIILMYLILIGTFPDDKREQCRIGHITNPDRKNEYTPAAKTLQHKWEVLPNGIKQILQRGIIDKVPLDLMTIIKELLVAYKDLAKVSFSRKLESFINIKPTTIENPRIHFYTSAMDIHDFSNEIKVVRF